MNKLIAIIIDYESDTFNARAQRVTRKEARLIAQSLLNDFYTMVEEGGRMYCDGMLLDYRLDAIRSLLQEGD